MKFIINREQLLKPLQSVSSVVERRQTLPILSNVLLSVTDNQLFMTGTDLEVELQTQIPLENCEMGEVTIPARKFLDICRALPDHANIELVLQENRVVIRSGKSRFVLSTLPANDFPKIEAIKETVELAIAQNVLKHAIDKTQFAMAQQDVRYYLNGMLLEVNEGNLMLVATDGHRLALCDTAQDLDCSEQVQVIIPRKGIIELSRLLEGEEETVTFQLGGNFVRISTSNMSFTSKLIDGRFPNYQNVLPSNTDKEVVCEREPLRQALQRVSILSNEKYRGIRMNFTPGMLKIFAHNPEQEEAEEEVEIDYCGEELEIGFNVNYIMDAVSAGNSDRVQIMLSDANSCCLIHGVDESDCKYVVMPMRL